MAALGMLEVAALLLDVDLGDGLLHGFIGLLSVGTLVSFGTIRVWITGTLAFVTVISFAGSLNRQASTGQWPPVDAPFALLYTAASQRLRRWGI